MIRTETEYQEAVRRHTEERARLADHQKRLEAEGLTGDELQRVLDPLRSFQLQLQEEIESYERLKRGLSIEAADIDAAVRFARTGGEGGDAEGIRTRKLRARVVKTSPPGFAQVASERERAELYLKFADKGSKVSFDKVPDLTPDEFQQFSDYVPD